MVNEIAGIYSRLSQDDGNTGESGSIQTQKTLLTQYCKEHGITIGDYYCDDGWSGTNFERPDFKRMLDDIEAGKINVVIVKDLSRFGREYAQMGMYIEHYFEEKGVRFLWLWLSDCRRSVSAGCIWRLPRWGSVKWSESSP